MTTFYENRVSQKKVYLLAKNLFGAHCLDFLNRWPKKFTRFLQAIASDVTTFYENRVSQKKVYLLSETRFWTLWPHGLSQRSENCHACLGM